jgi:hypothetical protein
LPDHKFLKICPQNQMGTLISNHSLAPVKVEG